VTPVVRPPKKCIGCQVNRVAWVKPRVDYCYDCLPGGPFSPPACGKCGSATYFSDGLCETCHPGGPLYPGSCRGCLAWGVYRAHCWLCNSCRWWQTHYSPGECDFCGRNTWIAEQGACRLCLEQARMLQEPGRALDLAGANRHGQQLFIANLQFKRFKTRRLAPEPRQQRSQICPAAWQQIPMFQLDPDPELVKQRTLNASSELAQYCKDIVGEHAATHGWSKRQRNDVIRSLRLLQILQDTPGGKIRATDVLQLPRYGGNIVSTIDVLDAAGLLIDDRPTKIEHYFAAKTDTLPTTMKTQLEVWLEVMLNGSANAPRRRSRDPLTARIHIMGITPIIQAWAAAGHESLAEITPEQGRTAQQRLASQLRRVRAPVAVHRLEGEEADLHQPDSRHALHAGERHRAVAAGHRGDPSGAELARSQARPVCRPGRLPRPDRQPAARPQGDRHRRRPTHLGRAEHPAG
jgi:hypothetical protein